MVSPYPKGAGGIISGIGEDCMAGLHGKVEGAVDVRRFFLAVGLSGAGDLKSPFPPLDFIFIWISRKKRRALINNF